MKLPRPSSRETPPHPRPRRAVEFLQDEARLDEEIMFDPERDITKKDWENIMADGNFSRFLPLKDAKSRDDWILHRSVLLTESLVTGRTVDDVSFGHLEATLEKCRRDKDWGLFAFAARKIALLFPMHRDRLNLNKEAWSGMKEALKTSRKYEEWLDFVDLAQALTILAAQDARITKDGRIEITPKKPALSNAPPPLPERRHV